MPGSSGSSLDSLWLWNSGVVLWNDDVAIVMCVVNGTDQDFTYGIAGRVDQYDIGQWRPIGSFVSTLSGWGHLGAIALNNEPMLAPAIGLGARGGRVGQTEYVSVAGLPNGRYRLSHRELSARTGAEHRVAAGELVVPERCEHPVPVRLGTSAEAKMVARPVVVAPTGGSVILAEAMPEAQARSSISNECNWAATIHPWQDGVWLQRGVSAPVDKCADEEWPLETVEAVLHVPPLAPGAYQVKWCRQDDVSLSCVIWVVEGLLQESPGRQSGR